MTWSEISRNPVAPEVHNYLLSQLLRKREVDGKCSLLRLEEFVRGHTVLDVGVVEHDISHIKSDQWKHKRIKDWSKKVVGVDILEKEVNYLNSEGYDVRLVDATSEVDIGERFDRITVGDVIEHVSDPVKLLKFCNRHLNPGGLILVSTPNPFFWAFILRVFRERKFIANAEHISWITPTMAVEIASRANLTMQKYYPEISRPRSILKRLVKLILNPLISEDSEVYAGSYVYIFGKQ